ncbi:MAG: hypothetical protein KatS3mg015_0728 [Fimbriimonadales bacterium]|nr:MAG: hypothetical protein KatS3mg015_0728 [Fimbriimonadales bacterium]
MSRIFVFVLAVVCAVAVGCGKKEAEYVPPNTRQIQDPITDLGSPAAMKRVEAAAKYLLAYVEETGKFPDVRTGLDLKKLLSEHFGKKVEAFSENSDELTAFDKVWVRNDGKGPILYNYALAGKSLDEIRNKENTWMLEDPMQFPGEGNVIAYVSGRVGVVKKEPVAGGM